jgi:hypothetical protein
MITAVTTPHRPSFNVTPPASPFALEYTAHVPPMAIGPQFQGVGIAVPQRPRSFWFTPRVTTAEYGLRGLGGVGGTVGSILAIGLGVALGLGGYAWWRSRRRGRR